MERVRFLRYDDSDLLFHQPRLRAELTALIRAERPRTIITHDPYPRQRLARCLRHLPDHTTLGLMTFQAAYLCGPGPLFYPEQLQAGLAPHRVEMLYLIMSDRPDLFIDVAPVWERRMAALRQHQSQGRDRPGAGRLLPRHRRRLGERAGCHLAEGFRRLAPT